MRLSTRLNHHYALSYSKKRIRLLAVLAITVALFGILLLTGLLDFLPTPRAPFPFSCNIPQFMAGPNAGSSCPIEDLNVCDVDEDTRGRAIEISDITNDGDTLLLLLSINIPDYTIANEVAKSLVSIIQNQLGKQFSPNDELVSGKRYAISLDEAGGFKRATIELDPANVFHCVKEGNRVRSWKEDVVLEYKTEEFSFRLQKDLVTSILAAHESKELALKLVRVFRWDIDFQADPRKGDVCKIIFERRYADDRPTGYGRILFSVYEGKRTGRKTACLFNGQYYDENGMALKKDYLRAPLNTLRITSGYGWRVHPVLNIWKFHTGVDYGAPTGTPVYAIANGIVTFHGCGDAYGLYVCISHENGHESRYSHLSRILVKAGQRVKQGQTIGLVGSTGRSTGPHLFFEIIINGNRINPTKIRMVRNPETVPDPLKNRFHSIVKSHKESLAEETQRSKRKT